MGIIRLTVLYFFFILALDKGETYNFMKLFNFLISPELLADMRSAATKSDRTAAAFVREAIREKVARERATASVLEFGAIPKPAMETRSDLSFGEPRPENKPMIDKLLGRVKAR